MPATPTLARVELHLSDDELIALQMFISHAIIMHHGGSDGPIMRAAANNHAMTDTMLAACKQAFHALKRVREERRTA